MKWSLMVLVVLLVGVLITATLYDRHARNVQAATLALPTREQNLVIFDAACEILKSHYYNPELFKTGKWRAYQAAWRERAAASQPGFFLYNNVLANFGGNFPESHVGFELPPPSPAPPPEHSSAASPRPGKAATPSEQSVEARLAALAKLNRILLTGPGFELATIRRKDMTTQIVDAVITGSAAERAGITPGWGVPESTIHMDEQGVEFKGTFFELRDDGALELERTGRPPGAATAGPRDPYTLAHGVEHAFALTSPVPGQKTFDTHRLANGATYLRFDDFNSFELMGKVFDAIDQTGPQGLVLDLRHNSGGKLWLLQRMLGRLLGNDVTIGTARDHGSSSRLRTWRWGSTYEGPLVVLIGPQSTSAAEITAAAVQDHRRGKLLGRFTNGSVLESRKLPLPDGGTMTFPVSDFVRTDGRHIEAVGVEPDIRVVPTLADVRAGRDPALDKALQLLGH